VKTKIITRLAHLDDFDDLTYVYEHDVSKHSQPFSKYPLSEWVNQPNVILTVAENEKKKMVAFMLVRLAGDVAKIDKYCVIKSYSNTGIPKQILESLIPICKNYTFSIYLPRKKKTLLNEFKTLGFKIIDEIPQLFGKGNDGLNLQKYSKVIAKRKAARRVKKQQVVQPRTEIKPVAEERNFEDVYNPENYIGF